MLEQPTTVELQCLPAQSVYSANTLKWLCEQLSVKSNQHGLD